MDMDKEAQEKLYKLLGENIRKYRAQAKLTQGQLAVKVGLTRTSVAKIEKGRQHTPLHLLLAIAKVLRADLNALIPIEVEYDPVIPGDDKTRQSMKPEDKNRFDKFYEDFLKQQR